MEWLKLVHCRFYPCICCLTTIDLRIPARLQTMADYWRFPDRMAAGPVPSKRLRGDYDDIPPPAAAGYYPHEDPRFDERDGRISWREPEPLGPVTDYARNGISYGPPGLAGSELPGLASGQVVGAGSVGLSSLGVSPLEEPSMMGQGGRMLGMDTGVIKSANMGMNGGMPDYITRQESQGHPGLLPPDAASTLYVEGLPSDCSKREAAHIFRPFVGFKEVRLVRKEAKRPSGDQLVLCFVDFVDPGCAATALEALQGYKFDETNHESESLRLQFARFPGPRGGRDDFRGGRERDDFLPGRPFRR